MRVRFDSDFIRDFEQAIKREWLVPNGFGGWSSSTVLGINTRKYHGLLVSSGRKLLLSKLEEELSFENSSFRLSANEYPGTLYPDGFRYIDSFELDCFPVFHYSLPGVSVKKTVFPLHMQDSVCVEYSINSEKGAKLRVFPLINSRSVYSTTRPNSLPFSQQAYARSFVLNGNLSLCSDLAGYLPSVLPDEKKWYQSMLYREDRARGEEFADSHYCPGSFEVSLPVGSSSFRILCGTAPLEKLRAQVLDSSLLHRELQRIWRLHSTGNEFLDGLRESADSFVISSGRERSVVAGYHWFSEWGRDSLISLPGLCLATGRFSDAKSILTHFSRFCRNGLMPNTLSPPAYNSADASLWFAHAAYQYYLHTKDLHFSGKMLEVIEEVIHNYSKGISLGCKSAIKMGSDSLLSCGTPDTNLTWMDATVGGKPVTPRNGKPVEINALWYNALKIACELSEKLGVDGEEYHHLSEGVKASFRKFWNPKEACLFDVLGPDDPSVRPNQLFALSLPFRMIEHAKEKLILEKLQSELLTPFGLRSLSPKDKKYIGVYCPKNERAYHNGAVWPYLSGPFISAYLRVNGHSPESKKYAISLLEPFKRHMSERGLGGISEVFDGNPPHNPGGCISQAWNTAELLRVCIGEKLFET